jgi:hypothetical protein
MNHHHTEVLDYIKANYAPTTIELRHGGDHPFIAFVVNGHSHRVTLQRDMSGASTMKMKIRDIHRLLGGPPERSTCPTKRRLEDMMPKPLAVLEDVWPKDDNTRPTTTTYDIGVACYAAARPGAPPRPRFFLPSALVAEFDNQLTYRVERIDDDTWKLTPDRTVLKPHLLPYGGEFVMDVGPDTSAAAHLFGRSPGEAIIVDGSIVARVYPEHKREVQKRAKRGSTILATSADAELAVGDTVTDPDFPDGLIIAHINTQQQGAPSLGTVSMAKEDTTDTAPTRAEIKACLEQLRRIERLTEFRLMRGKDSGQWAFAARID